MSFDDSLKHYGVLGMKWGVRKDERPGGSGGGRESGGFSEKKQTRLMSMQEMNQQLAQKNRRELALKTKKASELRRVSDTLTDEELRSKINRLQMEAQLKDLSRKEKNEVQTFFEAIVADVARKQITKAANRGVDAAVKKGSAYVRGKAASVRRR